MHDSVNVVLAVSAPEDAEPDVGRVPLQPPLAVQDVAFVLDHVSVELAPDATVVGLAVNVSVGAGCVCRVTVAEALLLPLALVQLSV